MAKKTGTSITKWDAKLAEMAQMATRTVKDVGAGGNVIGTAAGQLKWKGAAIPENKLRCVVLDHVLINMDYDGVYDPDNPASPRCYAFGRDKDTMAPHDESAEKQADACVGCPQNEWGSADRGRGKHCANKVRLGLLSESDLSEDIASAEVAYIHVPVTSVKNWAGFVRQVADTLHRPPLGVVCELSLVPSDNQFDILFKTVEQIDDGATIEQLVEKAERVAAEIEFPFPKFDPGTQPVKGRSSKPRGGSNARQPVAPPPRGRQVVPAAARGGKQKF